MSDIVSATITPTEQGFRQLRQVTVRNDDEVTSVNTLLAEGWRLVSIGHLTDATVYVLGAWKKSSGSARGSCPPTEPVVHKDVP